MNYIPAIAREVIAPEARSVWPEKRSVSCGSFLLLYRNPVLPITTSDIWSAEEDVGLAVELVPRKIRLV